MTLPRGGLPPVQFLETNASVIEAAVISTYEALTGRRLGLGDPVRLFLLSLASIIVQVNAANDDAMKQTYLSYARGSFIDHIGSMIGVTRQPASSAKTTIKFTLSTVLGEAKIIPAGTQVAAGNTFFATDEVLTIAPGALTGNVSASAVVPGIDGNGFPIGAIKTIVNPIPFVQKAENTEVSTGGAEEESDDAYAERIRMAPSSFSTAGPVKAYEYWTYSASPSIVDVSIVTPPTIADGHVDVYPLLEGGVIPSDALLEEVEAVLSADTIRPATDYVTVKKPVAENVSIEVDWYIRTEDLPRVVLIQDAVSAAVQDYISWQTGKIGRDVVPDELIKRMIEAGAKRVVVTSPVYDVLDATTVAQIAPEDVEVNYMGAEDA